MQLQVIGALALNFRFVLVFDNSRIKVQFRNKLTFCKVNMALQTILSVRLYVAPAYDQSHFVQSKRCNWKLYFPSHKFLTKLSGDYDSVLKEYVKKSDEYKFLLFRDFERDSLLLNKMSGMKEKK